MSLIEELKLIPLKKAKGNVGYTVGFDSPVFVGDTFYAGFLEFHFTDRGGNKVAGDSFLRKPLYDNETGIIGEIIEALRGLVRTINKTV